MTGNRKRIVRVRAHRRRTAGGISSVKQHGRTTQSRGVTLKKSSGSVEAKLGASIGVLGPSVSGEVKVKKKFR